eukprot:16060572-Heterocapsa_arctica.AAC.1
MPKLRCLPQALTSPRRRSHVLLQDVQLVAVDLVLLFQRTSSQLLSDTSRGQCCPRKKVVIHEHGRDQPAGSA